MATLYVVDQAVVRFWDTHDPAQARRRDGDVQVVCGECLTRRLELPHSHPGVHTLHPKEIGGEIYNVCKFCGDVDRRLVKSVAERLFKW